MKTIEVEEFADVPEAYYPKKVAMIAVYERPTDFPDKYVARLWDAGMWTPYAVIRTTREEILSVIPAYMTFIPPDANDDPVIVGTFI